MNTDNTPLALVTGGGVGIGAACVSALALSGYKVLIHCNRNSDPAKQLAETLPNSPVILTADLSEIKNIDLLVDQIKEHGKIHTLVNNAGISIDAPLFSAKIEDFNKTVDINLQCTWYLTKRVARLMMKQRAGKIINISSVIGTTGNVGQSVYGMTKAAIDNFTKSAAMELAPFGISVHSISPGFIETTMTKSLPEEIQNQILNRIPMKRMGLPDEIAKWVRFLAVEDTYSTGNIIQVNGGLYCG